MPLKAKKSKQRPKAARLSELNEGSTLGMAPRSEAPARLRPNRWAFPLAALLLPVVFLAALEIVFRLIGFGYPTDFFLKSQAQGRAVLIGNQKVAWRYFPPGQIGRASCRERVE